MVGSVSNGRFEDFKIPIEIRNNSIPFNVRGFVKSHLEKLHPFLVYLRVANHYNSDR